MNMKTCMGILMQKKQTFVPFLSTTVTYCNEGCCMLHDAMVRDEREGSCFFERVRKIRWSKGPKQCRLYDSTRRSRTLTAAGANTHTHTHTPHVDLGMWKQTSVDTVPCLRASWMSIQQLCHHRNRQRTRRKRGCPLWKQSTTRWAPKASRIHS